MYPNMRTKLKKKKFMLVSKILVLVWWVQTLWSDSRTFALRDKVLIIIMNLSGRKRFIGF